MAAAATATPAAPASPPVPRDLPKDAAHRLEELEHGLFTSDLSVNEFLWSRRPASIRWAS